MVLDTILQLDYFLFSIINQSIANSLLDICMPWFREPLFWVPLYVYFIVYICMHFNGYYWYILVFLITVGTSDMVSSHLIKKNIKRVRPCNNEQVYTLTKVRCGSGYSFTSSHAANHFSMATFFVLTFGVFKPSKNRYWAFGWAGLIAVAQVYVGVHFPLDIFFGALLGMVIGYLFFILFSTFYIKPNKVEML